uniref:Uncharacterized protein n=1 Tax=Panagrolaimus superbus TaxID=310955 RepID=A0A914Z2X9_9BILA
MEKCQYEYGGRLATAPSNDAFKFWTRTIHFNTKIDFNNLFWIGYGKNGFNNQEPDVKLKKFIDPQIW